MLVCCSNTPELEDVWSCGKGLGCQVCHIQCIVVGFEFDKVIHAHTVQVPVVHKYLAEDEASWAFFEMELKNEELEGSCAHPDWRN
jgi:hypothetical protein